MTPQPAAPGEPDTVGAGPPQLQAGEPDLAVSVGPLRLKNPVTVASGTFGYGREFADFYPPSLLGAIFIKGITTLPRAGNPTPRLVETPSGLINAIGLQNIGMDELEGTKGRDLAGLGTLVVANISGADPGDFEQLAARASRVPAIGALELNVSCPNLKSGGVDFGRSPALVRQITSLCAAASEVPVLVKLTPNVTDIVEIAAAAMESGAAGVTLVNTLLAMAIDVEKRRPVLANVMGGLSGPAIRPVAVRMVWQVWRALRCPIVGMGGIMTGDDAVEFMLAGAAAVSVGTANFVNPAAGRDVLAGVAGYCRRHGVARAADLTGAAHAA